MIFGAMLLAALGIGGYLVLFKRDKLKELAEDVQGYSAAKTPKEAADKFREAIKNRNFKAAAKYCTDRYATELKKGADAAGELAQALDDLTSRMVQSGVMTDELKIILYLYDPFWKDITITIAKETDTEAEATLVIDGLKFEGQGRAYESWNLASKNTVMRAFTYGWPMPPAELKVKIKKEGEGDKMQWRIDFPVSEKLQASVTRLNDYYKDYVNPIKIISQEIKNDPTTKENVKKRLKELLEEAARN